MTGSVTRNNTQPPGRMLSCRPSQVARSTGRQCLSAIPKVGCELFDRFFPVLRFLLARSEGQPVRAGKDLLMTGYCMKCRDRRDIHQAQQVTMKNGRPATRGKCGECGTTVFRIGAAT